MKNAKLWISLIVAAVFVFIGLRYVDDKKAEVEKMTDNEAVSQIPSPPALPEKLCYSAMDGKISTIYGAPVIGADASSFVELGNEDDCYGKDNKRAYYFGNVFKGPDLATFEFIGRCATKDKDHVYCGTKIVPQADPQTFSILSVPFAKDKNNVYRLNSLYGSEILPTADPETFQVLLGLYAKDAKNVFAPLFCGDDGCAASSILKDADTATFTALNPNYAKDKNRVYSYTFYEYESHLSQVDEANPVTFIALADSFAKDSSHVFSYDKVIPDADPSTFIVLGRNYGKDKNFVYYTTQKIPEADLATFIFEWSRSDWYYDARDKNHFYAKGKVVTPPAE